MVSTKYPLLDRMNIVFGFAGKPDDYERYLQVLLTLRAGSPLPKMNDLVPNMTGARATSCTALLFSKCSHRAHGQLIDVSASNPVNTHGRVAILFGLQRSLDGRRVGIDALVKMGLNTRHIQSLSINGESYIGTTSK